MPPSGTGIASRQPASKRMVCPYVGLRAFMPGEAECFFGREDHVDAMIDALADHRFVAVVGASGSGKSSLVHCGLLPALPISRIAGEQGDWRIVRLRPGAYPIRSLAQGLAQSGVLWPAEPDSGPHPRQPEVTNPLPAQLTPPLGELIEASLRLGPDGLVDAVHQAHLPSSTQVLILVDQFEELFRFAQAASEAAAVTDPAPMAAPDAAADRAAFVRLLLHAVAHPDSPVRVVLTLRSDFIGDCAAYPALARAINDSQFLVPAMDRRARRRAIEGPMALRGGQMDPALVQRLLNDVGDDADHLPLLQHALQQMWLFAFRRDGCVTSLGLTEYDAIGTLAHALDRHADHVLASMDEPAQALTQRVLQALTDRVHDPRGRRRPCRLAALLAITGADEARLREVIDRLRDPDNGFVQPALPAGLQHATVIDIAHESLMRQWRRLSDWVEEESADVRQLHRLSDGARLWSAGRTGLLSAPELDFTADWHRRRQPRSAWAAQYGIDLNAANAYLEASLQAQASQRLLQQGRARRQRTAVAAALVALLLVATAMFLLWRQAREQTDIARTANARKLGPQALSMLAPGSPYPVDLALQTAAVATRLSADPGAWRDLHDVVLRTGKIEHVTPLSGNVLAIDARHKLVALSQDRLLIVSGMRDGVTSWASDMGQGDLAAAAFHPDGDRLAVAMGDGSVALIDGRTGSLLGDPVQIGEPAWTIAFDQSGTWLAVGDERGTVHLIPVRDRARLDPLHAQSASVGHARIMALASHPRRPVLAAGTDDGELRVLTLSGGRWQTGLALSNDGNHLLPALRRAGRPIAALAFDQDSRLAVARRVSPSSAEVGPAPANAVGVWNWQTGQPIGTEAHPDDTRLFAIAMDATGSQLAAAGEGKSVHYWTLTNQGPVKETELDGHIARVWSLQFSPDGTMLMSGGRDQELITWQPQTLSSTTLLRSERAIRALAQSADGEVHFAGSDAGELTRSAGASLRQRRLGSPVTALALSPDGATLYAATERGQVFLMDPDTLADRAAALEAGDAPVWAITVLPDGVLATADQRGQVSLWDAQLARRLAQETPSAGKPVWSLVHSPDGQWLAAGADDGSISIWHPLAGALVIQSRWRAHRHGPVSAMAFSQDGTTLFSAGQGDSNRAWNVRSGTAIAALISSSDDSDTNALAVSADGRWLAAGQESGRIHFFATQTLAYLGDAERRDTGAVNVLQFAPDGMKILVGTGPQAGADHTGLVPGQLQTLAAPAAWQTMACDKVSRNMSQRLWKELIGSFVPYQLSCPGRPVAAD